MTPADRAPAKPAADGGDGGGTSNIPGALAGVTFAAVLAFVAVTVLPSLKIPEELTGVSQISGAAGIIAGTIIGWEMRRRLKAFGPAWAAAWGFAVVLVCALGVFYLVTADAGLNQALIVIALSSVLCLALGWLAALGGLSLFSTDAK